MSARPNITAAYYSLMASHAAALARADKRAEALALALDSLITDVEHYAGDDAPQDSLRIIAARARAELASLLVQS
jgi:hypothetical protein